MLPGVARLDDLIDFCDRLLDAGAYEDYGPNGLQVPGPDEVTTVVTGVSACADLFTAAADRGAQLVLVHHGLFWRGAPLGLDRVTAARLRLLFRGDVGLAAYHLPLDGHPEIGNNALLARALDPSTVQPAFEHGGRPLGVVATFADPIPVGELAQRIAIACDRIPLHLDGGPERIARLGIVTGGAPDDIVPAAALGCDAFLTGEPTERVTALARELGLHFFAAGHHATETFGVRALGDRLAQQFGVEHVWVDVPNPV
jgi:dinuclear metal center YbgI/SA1388 family protein